MDQTKPIPDEEWRAIVRNVPVVSVDLVVQNGAEVLLGKRTNEPAKGEWFVPGGTVFKNEQFTDAVHRIAKEELGIPVEIDRQLGVYEHFYDIADVADTGGKHYVPVAYLVNSQMSDINSDDQHEEMNWYQPPFDEVELHPYVRSYLRDAGFPC